MKKRLVLKPLAVGILYGVFLILVLVGALYSIKYESDTDEIIYVNHSILDEYIPVVNSEEKIKEPFSGKDVEVLNDYYDYQNEETQEKSIIFYENTYVQNTGINYTSKEKFDVISILDGEVIDIKEDTLLGNTITIKHDNNLISIYSTVDNIKVKKGSKVITGEVIAESSTSSILKDNNNLHFELYHNGEVVNPNNYYNKSLKEF